MLPASLESGAWWPQGDPRLTRGGSPTGYQGAKGLFLSCSTEEGLQEGLLGSVTVLCAREGTDLPATALHAAV